MVLAVQKKMMISKLTEFLIECDNDEKLTYFIQQVYNGKIAHSTFDRSTGEKSIVVIFNDRTQSVLYKPQELIEEIFEDESRIDSIRTTVHFIRENKDYKDVVNIFNK